MFREIGLLGAEPALWEQRDHVEPSLATGEVEMAVFVTALLVDGHRPLLSARFIAAGARESSPDASRRQNGPANGIGQVSMRAEMCSGGYRWISRSGIRLTLAACGRRLHGRFQFFPVNVALGRGIEVSPSS